MQDRPPVIVDASVVFEWLIGNPVWAGAFDSWAEDDRLLMAPVHMLLEAANSQLRGRGVAVDHITMRIDQLYGSAIELTETNRRRLVEALDLAQRHRLTVYDALYLQLAIDVDGQLATLDKALVRAAVAEDVGVIGLD